MKKLVCSFILFICCCSTFAAGLTLQFQIKGIQDPTLENAKNSLKALETMVAKPTTATGIENFYHKAPNAIKSALQPFGYFHAKVKQQLHKDKNKIITVFFVTPGPVTYIRSSTIRLTGPGSDNAALQTLLLSAKETLAVKQPLNTVSYDKLKQEFYATAENEGYLKGYFSDHLILVNRRANTASIKLTFNTGPRYYFGAVYYSKNPMAISFLNRYLPFHYGTPYSSQKLLTLQNNLSSTIYFKQVNVTSNIKQAKNYHIPVDVKLTAAKSQKYSFGLGYGTDTGLRGNLGWEWRRVTNTGHYFQALFQVSQKQNNNLQMRYIIPGKNPMTDYYALTAGIFTNEPGDDNKYTTEQVGLDYVKLINDWQRTLSLQLQHENFTVDDVSSTTNTLIPGVSWEKVVAPNRVNVTNGYRLYLNLDAGAVTPSTNASFFQSEFQGKYIRSTDDQKNRLLLMTDIGATLVKNFDDMPLSQRFFAGGSQSLRGYAYQDLGPGRYLAIGSIEWQRLLHGKFYGAAFYNAGNAVQNLHSFHFEQAAGLGIVYRSPIGPIELTIAHPFNEPFQFNKRGLNIQFTMGPDL